MQGIRRPARRHVGGSAREAPSGRWLQGMDGSANAGAKCKLPGSNRGRATRAGLDARTATARKSSEERRTPRRDPRGARYQQRKGRAEAPQCGGQQARREGEPRDGHATKQRRHSRDRATRKAAPPREQARAEPRATTAGDAITQAKPGRGQEGEHPRWSALPQGRAAGRGGALERRESRTGGTKRRRPRRVEGSGNAPGQ